jgi:ribosomal protein L30/L7E
MKSTIKIKSSLQKTVRMLMGLIKSNSTHEYDEGNAAHSVLLFLVLLL